MMDQVRRSEVKYSAILLLVLSLWSCHQGQRTNPGPRTVPPANANVLERHEMSPNASSFLELIQGRLPGVLIRQQGANISVEIRGLTSVGGRNEALILVDGVESTGRALTAINPADVERVEVVKDGAAAIYGLRGANGVLLVTTRRE
jgi:TonB-dependent starch-binding outer membrane protein SusC